MKGQLSHTLDKRSCAAKVLEKRDTLNRNPRRRRKAGAKEEEMESRSKTGELDAPLQAIGFEIDEVSPKRLTGRLKVTAVCCQPFKVLHGGISALIAEALASIGAHMASGFKRVAGVQLSINHLNSAQLGDDVVAEAQPIKVGKTIQVWEVTLWKIDPSTAENRVVVASSRVTLLSNMPVPPHTRDAAETLRKHAKL